MVASLLTQEIIPHFGLPATTQSDNGPAFTAQSSGKVEQAHSILKDHLTKLAIEVKLSWPTLLPLALAQVRAIPWGPTGLSPFELLYGRPFLGACISYSPCPSGTRGPPPSSTSPARQQHSPLRAQTRISAAQVVKTSHCYPNHPHSSQAPGYTLWYHVSRLKLAPQNDQWKFEPLGPTHLHLAHCPNPSPPNPLEPPPDANSNVWRFYIQESWVEGPTTRTHYSAQADCQPAGCQSAVIIEIKKKQKPKLFRSPPTPGLCFLYDQKHDYCHWWNTTYGGCHYNSCEIHMPTECHETQNNCKDGKQLFLTIRDPWDDHCVEGVTGKTYNFWLNSHPQGTWLIFRSYTRIVPEGIEQLSSMSHTILQKEATLTNRFKPSNSTSPPFSWLTLVQQEANMLNITKTMNITNCFLCASLSNPPWLQSGFNLSQSPTGPYITLTDILLFKGHSQNFSLCCKTASSSSPSCNTTVKVKSSLYAPPGGYFWCNGTLTKVINASLPFPCVPVILVPQLEVYDRLNFYPSFHLPLITRTDEQCSFQWSLASVTSATQLEDKLHVAIEASAASLASLQRQIKPLAQEQCCYDINETGLAEENVNTIASKKTSVRSKMRQSRLSTGLHDGNFQGGRKPDATSTLCPTPSPGTSQLTLPPTPPLFNRKQPERSGVLYHQKRRNVRPAASPGGRTHPPISALGTHLCTQHPPLHSTPDSAPGTHLCSRHLACAQHLALHMAPLEGPG
ncbi:Endogenous retrovirus group FC1 Env polyprotein [Plecturocebus cupreus]